VKRFAILSLMLLVGCTIDANGIRIDVPQWGKVTPVVVPPRPDEPITTKEFRCLIIEDNSDKARSRLTSAQNAILFGTGPDSVKAFLTANCVESKDAEGATDEGWMQVAKDEQLPGLWAALKAKHPPTGYPWMILSNGSQSEGFVITDYPTSLLNKYAGVK